MNIKECLEQQVKVVTPLTEKFIARVICDECVEVTRPVDVKVKDIHIPMQRTNVDFEYTVDTKTMGGTLGQYYMDVFTPVGETMSVNCKEMTVIGYGEPMRNYFGQNPFTYYVDVQVQSNDPLTPGRRITNDFAEDTVLNALTQLICVNDAIKQTLPKYNVNIIDALEMSTELLENVKGLAEDLPFLDKIIRDGITTNMNHVFNYGSSDDKIDTIDHYLTYANKPDIEIRHGHTSIYVNAMTFVSYLVKYIYNELERPNGMPTGFFDNVNLEMIRLMGNSALETDEDPVTKIEYKSAGRYVFLLVKTSVQSKYNGLIIIDTEDTKAQNADDLVIDGTINLKAYYTLISKYYEEDSEVIVYSFEGNEVFDIDPENEEENANIPKDRGLGIYLKSWSKVADFMSIITMTLDQGMTPADYYKDYVPGAIGMDTPVDERLAIQPNEGLNFYKLTFNGETVIF